MQYENRNILDELVHKGTSSKDQVFTEEQDILLEVLKGVRLLDFKV